MTWLFTSLNWYFYILIIGLLFFPLTKKIFSRFSFDSGYPFAKTLAVIFVSYAIYVLGTIKFLEFSRMNLFLIISVFLLLNVILGRSQRRRLQNPNEDSGQARMTIIVFEEILFLASFGHSSAPRNRRSEVWKNLWILAS